MECTDQKLLEKIDGVPTSSSTSTPVVSSETLMQGASELRIVHRGDVYRLRVTRSGKLILQK
jgi:hemin uptake protein HemP